MAGKLAAQLTNLDVQFSFTQVYEDEEKAKIKGGLADEKLFVNLPDGNTYTPFTYLKMKLEPDSYLGMVSQVYFMKSRDENPLEQTHYIGYAYRIKDGSMYVVSTRSNKQYARYFYNMGKSVRDIAKLLNTNDPLVTKWLQL